MRRQINNKGELLTIAFFAVFAVAVAVSVYFSAPRTYPNHCIDKLEEFAGEDSFSLNSCARDLDRAEDLRADKMEVCR